MLCRKVISQLWPKHGQGVFLTRRAAPLTAKSYLHSPPLEHLNEDELMMRDMGSK